MIDLEKYINVVENVDLIKKNGKISRIVGIIIESIGPSCMIGELCFIKKKQSKVKIRAEVIGFKDNKVLLMALGELEGISPGCIVEGTGKSLTVKINDNIIGRIIDGFGNPMDDKGEIAGNLIEYPVINQPPNPFKRKRIKDQISLGVRAIDGILTVGQGQRIGIFAGSGVGKSTLMGMIARNTSADINVISLVGERGREVREFIEKDLGEEGLKRSVVVCATSDMPALIRIKGAYIGTAIAEYFRDKGKNVMLMMDSVTRFALAQREVGLAAGEPPATRGYTPSVFALLPKLLERSGTSDKGTITAIYTVLVEGSDMDEPVADAVRGILDGHFVLSRNLATKNHFPAIDILESVSRLVTEINTKEHYKLIGEFRKYLSTYNEAQDLINIGAYKAGSNPEIDLSISLIGKLNSFLRQEITEKSNLKDTIKELENIFKK